MKNIAKYFNEIIDNIKVIQITLTFIFTASCFLLIPMLFGYRISYATNVKYDFEAIGAITGIIGGIVLPVVLVFLSAFVTRQFDKKKQDIGELNIATIEHVEKVKEEINETLEKKPKVIDGGFFSDEEEIKFRKYKDKAYKFVCKSMIVKTHAVAEHLGLNDKEAFSILIELLRVDGTISCGGRATMDNIDNVVWMKK